MYHCTLIGNKVAKPYAVINLRKLFPLFSIQFTINLFD